MKNTKLTIAAAFIMAVSFVFAGCSGGAGSATKTPVYIPVVTKAPVRAVGNVNANIGYGGQVAYDKETGTTIVMSEGSINSMDQADGTLTKLGDSGDKVNVDRPNLNIYNERIYFKTVDNTIGSVDLTGGDFVDTGYPCGEEMLIIDGLAYTDKDSAYNSIDLADGTTVDLPITNVDFPLYIGNKIYYINNGIHSYDLETQEDAVLLERDVTGLCGDGKLLYYTDQESHYGCKLGTEGGSPSAIYFNSLVTSTNVVIANDSTLCLLIDEDNNIIRARSATTFNIATVDQVSEPLTRLYSANSWVIVYVGDVATIYDASGL